MADILVSIHGKRLGISAPDPTSGKASLLLDGVAIAGVTVQSAITALTDSSGGTSGGNTVPAVAAATAATTDTSAASLVSTNAAITALKNDIATLTAKQNATLAAIKSAGVTL